MGKRGRTGRGGTRAEAGGVRSIMGAAGPLGLVAAVIDQAVIDMGRPGAAGDQARRWLYSEEPDPAVPAAFCLQLFGLESPSEAIRVFNQLRQKDRDKGLIIGD